MQRIAVATVVAILIFAYGFGLDSRLFSEPMPMSATTEKPPASTVACLRRPVVVIPHGNRILVGNRTSGTISVIDPIAGNVVAEHRVAKRIADVVAVSDSEAMFVLDDESKQLLKMTLRDGEVQVESIADVPALAVKLAISPSQKRLFVNSKWSQQLVAIDFDDRFEQVSNVRTVPLPFASHQMLLHDAAQRLLVADAFGGRIAVIDAASLEEIGLRELSGHNIRGLTLSADRKALLVAQQQIKPSGRADYEELHWGRLVTNGVEHFNLQDFIFVDNARADASAVTRGWVDEFGGIGGASADPAAVVTTADDVMAVCFSGSNEVTIRAGGNARRVPVGRRPVAMAVLDGQLFVANHFDETISVVQVKTGRVERTIPLGRTPQLTSAQRGELLFFDASLSHDRWMSCHSCHTDGHSAGLLIDTLGDGDYGAPKRVPSLLGTGDTAPWGWTGSKQMLAAQIQTSVTTTMHGDRLNDRRLHDLENYLKSLAPPPSMTPTSPELLERGRKLFTAKGCVDCHAPPTYTTAATYDVGLVDEKGRGEFNPPSLRGVGRRTSLFHDGRAANLQELLLQHQHQLKQPLNKQDATAFSAFLQSL